MPEDSSLVELCYMPRKVDYEAMVGGNGHRGVGTGRNGMSSSSATSYLSCRNLLLKTRLCALCSQRDVDVAQNQGPPTYPETDGLMLRCGPT